MQFEVAQRRRPSIGYWLIAACCLVPGLGIVPALLGLVVAAVDRDARRVRAYAWLIGFAIVWAFVFALWQPLVITPQPA
jgi:hypothetical protein